MHTTPMEEMLRTIEAECRLTQGLTGTAALKPEVMRAMGSVPRHEFVPEAMKAMAYADSPLPIGSGQTISQPFIVALMTDLLNPKEGDVILEVGSGSGYQAAILSRLVSKVYSIEIIPFLAAGAAEHLAAQGYNNVEVILGDGYQGLPEHAPYNGIIVTAAAPHVPPPLKEQLCPGGRLVIPVGFPHMPQQLLVLEKDENGVFSTREVLSVAFVPLTGELE